MAAAPKFHSRTGSLAVLSNENRTAQRNHPTQEFNNGVVISAEPLKDNVPFEVKIDKKVNSWSGSIEIGVTTCDPSNLNFPISATGFREGTWVMSGSSILRDGHSVIEEYGADLDQLGEGEKVGVMRTSLGVLHFLVNGIDQGPAATGIAPKVYAVIDMYGKCAQVSVVDNATTDTNQENDVITNDVASQLANEFLTQLSNQIVNDLTRSAEVLGSDNIYLHSNERLTFHERCGSLVKLSNNRRTAERRRPLDEFNNGIVMTNRPLKNDEMFEIRLDVLVDKWSGSIEVGITTHNPSMLDFPATMTNMRSGTIMMSGCGILTNGKGTRREYGQYNLDELAEGDRIGLMRKSNGHLHYYINGEDQGVASTETPVTIWGVVDLYGMAVKVTILDRNDPSYPNIVGTPAQRNTNIFRQFPDMYDEYSLEENETVEKLMFNPCCGSHAAVINGQRTAHRPNALDDFNNGVVLTNRTLRPEELFEVRIDKMVDKWAGSIEIGVTLHSPSDLDFPSTMTNIRSGTWMMTGNGVMHNGTTVIDEYGQNLDRLKVGDRVGVRRKTDGTLHFYVNNTDQGAAASNVPEMVYGVIDLYGQAAEATIVDHTDLLSPDVESSIGCESEELKFHFMHGQNASILNNGRTSTRPNATGEFNDAIVVSNRPLKDNELFEVIIEKMVDRWSGSIEAGVTLIKPEDLDFPSTMTDIEYDTWMLSGAAIMQDGSTIRNGYPLDLDGVTVGFRIGMMRCSDGTLHYYLNGVDQGVACTDLPPGVFAVIDLYGQCAQVSITSGSGVLPALENNLLQSDRAMISPSSTDITHRYSHCCGKNITIKNNSCTAVRSRNFNHGLVFSSDPLKKDELFEIKVDQISRVWSGSLHIGLTTLAISDTTPVSLLPSTAIDLTSKLTWVITGSEVRKNGLVIKENYAPALERLEVGDCVGVRRCSDGTLHLYINNEDLGVAASNIPKNVFAVIDLFGSVEMISVTSSSPADNSIFASQQSQSVNSDLADSVEVDPDDDVTLCSFEFHGNHGKNIMISNNGQTAERTESYNQGIIITNRPLPRNKLYQVKIEKLNPRWSSSLMIGVLGFPPDRFNLPVSSMCIKKSCITIQADAVYNSGSKMKELYGPNLDRLQVGHVIGLLVDNDACLHLYVNGADQGIAARDVPYPCYIVVDLYGQCEKITVVKEDSGAFSFPHSVVVDDREKADIDDVVKEKMCRNNIENNLVRNCEYMKICSRVKTLMGLPEGYFEQHMNLCFCETCHKVRGDEMYHKLGEPAREYAVPYGWCRFTLKMQQKAHSLGVSEKWHVGYYGTHMEALRQILDSGDIHAFNEITGGGSILVSQSVPFTEKSRPDSSSLKQIFMSPTIRYAGCNEFSTKHRMLDPKTRKTYHVRVAFQVWVKPGSYKIGPQSLGVNEQIDPKFLNNELEWCTKERGSVILHGLLIKIENL